jgi:hypothetical protein
MKTDAGQHVFDENFDRTLARLQAESHKPDFDLATVEGELSALYLYEGQDWVGRGELKHAEIEGSILAYQVFLRRRQEELGKKV